MSTVVKRVQLSLHDTADHRLQELTRKTEAESYADVIMNALRLYEAVIDEVDRGGTFMLRTADGNTAEYAVFGYKAESGAG